jgi:hypothetical protein
VARGERQAAYLAGLLEILPVCNDETWERYTHSRVHFETLLALRKQLERQGSIEAVATTLGVNSGTIHRAIYKGMVSPKLRRALRIDREVSYDDLFEENIDLGRRVEYLSDATRDMQITIETLEQETQAVIPHPAEAQPAKSRPKSKPRPGVNLTIRVEPDERQSIHTIAASLEMTTQDMIKALAAGRLVIKEGE